MAIVWGIPDSTSKNFPDSGIWIASKRVTFWLILWTFSLQKWWTCQFSLLILTVLVYNTKLLNRNLVFLIPTTLSVRKVRIEITRRNSKRKVHFSNLSKGWKFLRVNWSKNSFVKPSRLCNTTLELLSMALLRLQDKYFKIHYIFLKKDSHKKQPWPLVQNKSRFAGTVS